MVGLMPSGSKTTFFWSLPSDPGEARRLNPGLSIEDGRICLFDAERFREHVARVTPNGSHAASAVESLDLARYSDVWMPQLHSHRLDQAPVIVVGDAAHAMSPQLFIIFFLLFFFL